MLRSFAGPGLPGLELFAPAALSQVRAAFSSDLPDRAPVLACHSIVRFSDTRAFWNPEGVHQMTQPPDRYFEQNGGLFEVEANRSQHVLDIGFPLGVQGVGAVAVWSSRLFLLGAFLCVMHHGPPGDLNLPGGKAPYALPFQSKQCADKAA